MSQSLTTVVFMDPTLNRQASGGKGILSVSERRGSELWPLGVIA